MYRTVRGSQRGQLSWSLILLTTTATTCSICFIERVCATVRPCLSKANRCRQMEWEKTAAETQRTTYVFYLIHTCPTHLL